MCKHAVKGVIGGKKSLNLRNVEQRNIFQVMSWKLGVVEY